MTTPRVKYVVLNENILGLIYPEQPYQMQILATSVIRGAPGYLDGTYPLPIDGKGVRSATRQDFEEFRVSSYGFDRDAADTS